MEYKVAIIGAGPGGYVAAIHAARLGMKVCLIEKDEVGGVCLNWGCIPTKTLVGSAKVLTLINKAADFGVQIIGEVHPDWNRILERKKQVVARLVKGIHYLLEQNHVELIRGAAVFNAGHELKVTLVDGGERLVQADSIIIATGSEPQAPEIFDYDGVRVITSNEALTLPELPESLAIIGGGVIGCEFASIFASLGVKVTIVELMDQLIPNLDSEISGSLRMQLKKKGIEIRTSTSVSKVLKSEKAVSLVFSDGKELTVAKVLVSIGRRPNSNRLGLEGIGVKINAKGRIEVNQNLQTNLPWIYAIGDVNDQPWDLAHAASYQGVATVEHLTGKPVVWPDEAMPNCIFTDPEVAAVGMTDKEAIDQGMETVTSKAPFLANGKALAQGEAVGLVKVVADKKSHRILGVQIIGPEASDLIAEAALAVKQHLTAEQVVETIHAHPTLAESLHEACEAVTR
ncbi:MAG TPA: dihydrolipoyl dehydrogenase [Bacillota bacterium]|nr:dihydrolipoyl dehydrogenase [Bacillota bacterium]